MSGLEDRDVPVPLRLELKIENAPRQTVWLDLSQLKPTPRELFLHNLHKTAWCETIWYGTVTQKELNSALERIVDQL